jgi:hypothetical protein
MRTTAFSLAARRSHAQINTLCCIAKQNGFQAYHQGLQCGLLHCAIFTAYFLPLMKPVLSH